MCFRGSGVASLMSEPLTADSDPDDSAAALLCCATSESVLTSPVTQLPSVLCNKSEIKELHPLLASSYDHIS